MILKIIKNDLDEHNIENRTTMGNLITVQPEAPAKRQHSPSAPTPRKMSYRGMLFYCDFHEGKYICTQKSLHRRILLLWVVTSYPLRLRCSNSRCHKQSQPILVSIHI